MFKKLQSGLTTNKYVKTLLLGGLAFLVLNLHGCLLDAFNTLTQELPYSIDVNISTTGTSKEESKTVNLDDNDFYKSNKDKINEIQLVKIAYKTKSVSPNDLTGTITLTVKQENGVILFSKVIPNNKPVDYLNTAYEISLTQSEIQLVNAYLSILSNRTFTATVRIETTTTGTKNLEAQVFVVFEMNYDL